MLACVHKRTAPTDGRDASRASHDRIARACVRACTVGSAAPVISLSNHRAAPRRAARGLTEPRDPRSMFTGAILGFAVMGCLPASWTVGFGRKSALPLDRSEHSSPVHPSNRRARRSQAVWGRPDTRRFGSARQNARAAPRRCHERSQWALPHSAQRTAPSRPSATRRAASRAAL